MHSGQGVKFSMCVYMVCMCLAARWHPGACMQHAAAACAHSVRDAPSSPSHSPITQPACTVNLISHPAPPRKLYYFSFPACQNSLFNPLNPARRVDKYSDVLLRSTKNGVACRVVAAWAHGKCGHWPARAPTAEVIRNAANNVVSMSVLNRHAASAQKTRQAG